MAVLRLVLGDQLAQDIAALDGYDKDNDIILMCEVGEEAAYVKHHKKKIAFLFSAMRHFAQGLRHKGFHVDYVKLDDDGNTGTFRGEVKRAVARHNLSEIVVTFPGEYRVLEDIKSWEKDFGAKVDIREDNRFLSTPADFAAWAQERKALRMEYFYRKMRRKHNILMEGEGEPAGGQWNYDAENRASLPADKTPPSPVKFQPDEITKEVMTLVEKRFDSHFGTLENFHFAVTRQEALKALRQFVETRLPLFGDYQDAMKQGEPFLYHSLLGAYLNAGLLQPREVIYKAVSAYEEGAAPLNAVEGFVRQILGWREFVRGLYWLKMPEYAHKNFFNAQRKLPAFYWQPDKTEMNCVRQCVQETHDHAYAHHIQRLMVLGNFALLAGLHPGDVNEWYLLVYADAFEWVELPNVSGMTLFADGGLLASKPYAASGSYISKMSDYCAGCRYDVKEKTGVHACPFNYLYWDFLARNRDKLAGNQRLGMIYSTLDRMDKDKVDAMRAAARHFLESL